MQSPVPVTLLWLLAMVLVATPTLAKDKDSEKESEVEIARGSGHDDSYSGHDDSYSGHDDTYSGYTYDYYVKPNKGCNKKKCSTQYGTGYCSNRGCEPFQFVDKKGSKQCGRDCSCCVDHVVVNPCIPRECAEGDGVCLPSCNNDQKVDVSGTKKCRRYGGSCTCCVDKNKCDKNKLCGGKGGVCREKCNMYEYEDCDGAKECMRSSRTCDRCCAPFPFFIANNMMNYMGPYMGNDYKREANDDES